MALRSGLDTVAITSRGAYTETYISATGGENIASLFASIGLLEEAPSAGEAVDGGVVGEWFWEFIE